MLAELKSEVVLVAIRRRYRNRVAAAVAAAGMLAVVAWISWPPPGSAPPSAGTYQAKAPATESAQPSVLRISGNPRIVTNDPQVIGRYVVSSRQLEPSRLRFQAVPDEGLQDLLAETGQPLFVVRCDDQILLWKAEPEASSTGLQQP
jgi:hypothetical protein